MAIQCNTREHGDVKGLAWSAIIIYPIGLIVLYGTLLFKARHAILTGRETALSRAIRFLYREYHPHFFWWEVIFSMRARAAPPLRCRYQSRLLAFIPKP